MNAKSLETLYNMFGEIPFKIQRSMECVTYVLESVEIGYVFFHQNRFDNRFVTEFHTLLDLISIDIKKDRIKMLILMSIEKDFSTGINLREIYSITNELEAEKFCKRRQKLCRRLFKLLIPTTCVIRGKCIGFGYEIACSCHRIVGIDSVKFSISFPQIQFGLVPCAGGSWTLSRRIGLKNALEVLLLSKSYNVESSKQYNLIDDVIVGDSKTFDRVRSHVAKFAYIVVQRENFWTTWILESNCLGRKVLESTIRNTLDSFNLTGYRIPYEMLESVLECYSLPKKEAFSLERKKFTSLVCCQESKNMASLYFIMNDHQILKGQKTPSLKSVAIIGRKYAISI